MWCLPSKIIVQTGNQSVVWLGLWWRKFHVLWLHMRGPTVKTICVCGDQGIEWDWGRMLRGVMLQMRCKERYTKLGGESVPDLGEKKLWKGPKANESKEVNVKKNEIRSLLRINLHRALYDI